MPKNEQVKYPDSILTDSGRMVRLSNLNPETKIKVAGRMVRVGDIPITVATLACEESPTVRGIAIAVGDHIFCERHHADSRVVKVEQ